MNSVQCQDEILQMMYWMRGEGLGELVTPEQLNRFLGIDDGMLRAALAQLVSAELVVCAGSAYQLTPRGISEGGRRFADEFSSLLGKENHLSCSDPGCDCHSPGWDGACPSLDPLR